MLNDPRFEHHEEGPPADEQPLGWVIRQTYLDMQVVKPAVVALVAADLPNRVTALENRNRDIDTVANERRKWVAITNRGLSIAALIVSIVVAIASMKP